jgi:hypothetical protein
LSVLPGSLAAMRDHLEDFQEIKKQKIRTKTHHNQLRFCSCEKRYSSKSASKVDYWKQILLPFFPKIAFCFYWKKLSKSKALTCFQVSCEG